jgi:general secretion pathway protein D
MTTLRYLAVALFLTTTLLRAQPAPAEPNKESKVSINFPGTSVAEVLLFYETLTGKKIIRDSNLAGPDLVITVAQQVTREEAISLIESSLLLNGYSLVPSGDNTVKVLGTSRPPRAEGLPLYTEESALPENGDQVVIFFKPLQFIAPEEAVKILKEVIQLNSYGSMAAVPNAGAIVITDKTPVIRKALALLELIDLQPAQIVTEFITLKRANATKVVEILDSVFGKDKSGGQEAPRPAVTTADPASPEAAGGAPQVHSERDFTSGGSKFLADKRTNRVLVVTRRENQRFVRELIAQLDSAGSFETPYVRQLNYIPVAEVFPVLADMLRDKGDEDGGPGSGASPQSTPASVFNNSNSGSNFGSSGMGGSSSGSGSLDRPDTLADTAQQSAPQSITIGEIRIVGDNNENSIIVFGPPESKERARQILDLLDRRPKQVYLAVVIGQLRVGNGLDYGVSYLVKYQNFQPLQNWLGNSQNSGGAVASLSPQLFPGVDVLPDPSKLLSPETFATLSGLTIYGTIADSVDVFARFLETNNSFRTLSRPVIYTTNNRKATILSGQKVPVPVSSLTTTTAGIDDNAAITSNIEYQDVVLKLEVLPLINGDREVNLVIAQTNDNIIGYDTLSGNQVPRISTQKITTSVRVPNGRTIVLGGLISEDKDTNKEGIPYISRVPVLGTLLGGRTNKTKERRELIVMIQPVVVESNLDMMRSSSLEGGRSLLGDDAMELAAPPAEFVRPAPPTPTPKPKKNWLPWGSK